MPIAYKMTTLRSMVDSVIAVPLGFARQAVWYSYALRCTNGNRALSATGSSASLARVGLGERPVATSAIRDKPRQSFAGLWNISFGFFGIQIGFALQNA